MLPSYQEELRALRDIKGVIGAFVLDDSGELCLNDMPCVLEPRALGDIGPRLLRIIDALATSKGIETFAIRFVEHRLSIRSLVDAEAYLGVLSDTQTNLPALRMAMNLAVRKLHGLTLKPLCSGPSPFEEPIERSVPKTNPHSSETKTRLLYRGRTV